MKEIKISDITLKKISEDREVSLLFREKSAIASCADKIGADMATTRKAVDNDILPCWNGRQLQHSKGGSL